MNLQIGCKWNSLQFLFILKKNLLYYLMNWTLSLIINVYGWSLCCITLNIHILGVFK